MKTIEQMYNEAKALVEDRTYNIGEISETTGLQKTANGWVKPKSDPKLMEELERSNRFEQEKMAKGRQKKEDKIKQQRQEGEANARAFQEKVERGEIVYNKKSGQFEDKSNARKAVKRNKAIAIKNGDKTLYKIPNTQFYFNTPEEAESAILAESRYGSTYVKPSKDTEINNIQTSLGFKLDTNSSGKSIDKFIKKTGENEYAANVWSIGNNSKGTMITKLNETDKPNSIIKKENGKWKLFYKDRNGNETVLTEKENLTSTKDSAPRLTADTKIRLKK